MDISKTSTKRGILSTVIIASIAIHVVAALVLGTFKIVEALRPAEEAFQAPPIVEAPKPEPVYEPNNLEQLNRSSAPPRPTPIVVKSPDVSLPSLDIQVDVQNSSTGFGRGGGIGGGGASIRDMAIDGILIGDTRVKANKLGVIVALGKDPKNRRIRIGSQKSENDPVVAQEALKTIFKAFPEAVVVVASDLPTGNVAEDAFQQYNDQVSWHSAREISSMGGGLNGMDIKAFGKIAKAMKAGELKGWLDAAMKQIRQSVDKTDQIYFGALEGTDQKYAYITSPSMNTHYAFDFLINDIGVDAIYLYASLNVSPKTAGVKLAEGWEPVRKRAQREKVRVYVQSMTGSFSNSWKGVMDNLASSTGGEIVTMNTEAFYNVGKLRKNNNN